LLFEDTVIFMSRNQKWTLTVTHVETRKWTLTVTCRNQKVDSYGDTCSILNDFLFSIENRREQSIQERSCRKTIAVILYIWIIIMQILLL